MDRDEWPFEIYDNENACVIARCETKDDVKFLHSLLMDDEGPDYPNDKTIYGTVIVNFPPDQAQSFIRHFYGRKR